VKKLIAGISIGVSLFLFFATSVSANHSWGGYHWARTANPFTLKLGDNLSSNWDSYLSAASSDWSQSNVLDTTVVTGQGGKNCKATSGRVEVCNRKYGNNGWLGIAQIWINGSHITQGVTKMNDTYFNTSTYNTPAWKQMVMCQEVGHTFGLDHQDEAFDNPNLGTCMDYTSNPSGPPSNIHPNQHDYDELATIYSHTDSFNTIDMTTSQIAKQLGQLAAAQNLENPGEWGRMVKDNGKVALFERDFGFGFKLFTFVVWAN
jgi:hypothetical protein